MSRSFRRKYLPGKLEPQARNRARRGALGYDGVPDSAIYARDKWMCRMPVCLCPDGRAIDQALTGTGDPWEPSIDHETPIRDGGRDSAGNKRAAHRQCNSEAARLDGNVVAPRAPQPIGWTIGDAIAARGGLPADWFEQLQGQDEPEREAG